jgi:hypothetical protein
MYAMKKNTQGLDLRFLISIFLCVVITADKLYDLFGSTFQNYSYGLSHRGI